MSDKIAKSPEMIAKEAEIKTLVGKIKKSRTTLKSLKTRLSNSQKDFVSFQMKMQTEMISRMEKIQLTIQELLSYAKKLKKAKFISAGDKMALNDIIETFTGESLFGEDFEGYLEKKEKAENGEFDFEENARAKANDIFQEFNIEPPKEEKRKIRQVFIGLSSKFHPDKARTDKERKDFHVLMQEINTAYQNHDIDKLLEMERLYVSSEAIDLTGKAVTVDVLTEEINRLTRELTFLENQINRTSGEIKNFRKSDLGKALTQKNKAERSGHGFDTQVGELDEILEQMTLFKEAFKETLEKKEMSPLFYELLSGGMEEEDEFDLFARSLFDDDYDDDDDDDFDFESLFGKKPENMTEDDLKSILSKISKDSREGFIESKRGRIRKPKFKEDQMVEVSKDVYSFFYPKTNMKGWSGRIIEYYTEDGVEKYEVEFDNKTLEILTPEHISRAFNLDEYVGQYTFGKNELIKTKGKFDEIKVNEFRNRHYINHTFSDQSEAIKKIIIEALGLDYYVEPSENWINYFENRLILPLNTKTRGLLRGYKRGQKMKVIQPIGESEEFGLIVKCLVNDELIEYPLMDLTTSKKGNSKEKLILDAYSVFVEQYA